MQVCIAKANSMLLKSNIASAMQAYVSKRRVKVEDGDHRQRIEYTEIGKTTQTNQELHTNASGGMFK